MIKKQGDKYCVYSHDGKRSFGCYSSREEAVKRLQQIEYFKHAKSDNGNPFNEPQKPTDGKPPHKKKKKKKVVVDYAKQSKGEHMAEIKDPNAINAVDMAKTVMEDRKVPEVKLPSLKNMKAADGTVTLTVEGKAEANMVLKNIEGNMARMKEMKKLCERLMSGGLSGEEFCKLDGYMQEGIVHSMHQAGATTLDPRVLSKLIENRKGK